MNWLLFFSAVGYVISAAMIPVVLRRQMAPGASLAWLGIVFFHPYGGLVLYFLVGETRLGRWRVQRYCSVISRSRDRQSAASATKAKLESPYEPMVLQAQKISGMPVLPGNTVKWLETQPEMLDHLIADIDLAQGHVHLLYYIFANDSSGQRTVEALKRAVVRGVKCRLIADALASRDFFKSTLAGEIRKGGIELLAALPVAPWKRGIHRLDLRNHRKLAIIDGRIGYAGSHNLINADYGGRKGGPWLDLSGRFTGPVVDELAAVFGEDWDFETGVELDLTPVGTDPAPDGAQCCSMQVVPTGPATPDATYRRLLLAAIQCARHKLTITTPYFVPDDTTLTSLMMAADRGVDVKLIMPQKPDHFFTAAAGRAHYGKLMDAGVHIYLYQPCLLHAKTTTVDDAFALFGSANLDVRSFNLNFELSTLMYGKEVTDSLRSVQEGYLKDSKQLDPAEWKKRSALKYYADGAISLLSPLL